MVSDDHYSERKWAEHKKLVCREWRTAFQLLQLAAKNEKCIVAAGIRPVRGTFAQLAENSGRFLPPKSHCTFGMLQLNCQQICPPTRSARSSGGSVMLGDIRKVEHIYIACGYTDLRRGIDGLAQIVQNQFSLDPCSNSLFLFCGRRRDRIKALLWEGDGFVLLYKRVETGCFQWPRTKAEMRSLSWQEFRWLLEGLSVDQPKATKTIERVVL